MQRRGLDVGRHRSRQVTAPRVESADLILTAERDHVVKIATISPDAYLRSFTLPEFLGRAAGDPVADGRALGEWAQDLAVARSASEYLRSDVQEVWDPTGSSRRRFAQAVDEIAAVCADVVELIDRSVDDENRFEC